MASQEQEITEDLVFERAAQIGHDLASLRDFFRSRHGLEQYLPKNFDSLELPDKYVVRPAQPQQLIQAKAHRLGPIDEMVTRPPERLRDHDSENPFVAHTCHVVQREIFLVLYFLNHEPERLISQLDMGQRSMYWGFEIPLLRSDTITVEFLPAHQGSAV